MPTAFAAAQKGKGRIKVERQHMPDELHVTQDAY
jgi:hypothetical protein